MKIHRTLTALLAPLAATALLAPGGAALPQAHGQAGAQEDAAGRGQRAQPWPDEVVELFESLPIQEGGRIKPLHTFASFTLLRLNGKRSVEVADGERLTAVEWLLDTLFWPDAAVDYPSFLVQNAEVVEAAGIPLGKKKKRDHWSFEELRPGVAKLFQLAHEYTAIQEKDRSSVQQQIVVLAGNVDTFLRLVGALDFARVPLPGGSGLGAPFEGRATVDYHEVIQHGHELFARFERLSSDPASGAEGELSSLSTLLRSAAELGGGADLLAILPPDETVAETEEWRSPYDLFALALQDGPVASGQVELLARLEGMARGREDLPGFASELSGFHAGVLARAQARGEHAKLPLELAYYKTKLVPRSLYFYVAGFLAMALMWLRPRSRAVYVTTAGLVSVATALLVAGIVMRCVIRGRPPVSTLYETVLFVTATGTITALFIERINRRRIALAAAAILGTVGMFVANGYEMLDKRDTMPSLVAVLDTNFWLATHVTAITLGYSAGMLAALLASVYLLAKPFRARFRDQAFFKSLGRMVYGVLAFGLIFSAVGTILGGIWANDSWGRFWGWDPKENGAMLIVLSQIVILHARMGGYLREHGVCMAAAFGGTIVAFSWWGVNLLGVGLHSYGFTSGIHTALWTYYGLQWGIVGIGGLTWLVERARADALAESRLRKGARAPGERPPTDEQLEGQVDGVTA